MRKKKENTSGKKFATFADVQPFVGVGNGGGACCCRLKVSHA